MKEKIEEIIFLRGLAIIGIVLLHVTAYFLTPANSDFLVYKISLVLNQVVRFTLPMFLVISGFGLA
ncbi:MAG: acyltransferase family protein [Desulfitobacterium hafniense]|nr:acyltransferase family protein [Desulfitobacterium hafniense]